MSDTRRVGEGKVEGDGAHHKQARGPKGGHGYTRILVYRMVTRVGLGLQQTMAF